MTQDGADNVERGTLSEQRDVNAFLLRDLDYPEANRIVSIVRVDPTQPGNHRFGGISYLRLAVDAQQLEQIACYSPLALTLTAAAAPAARIRAAETTASLFDVLRIPPLKGRVFRAEEEVFEPDVALISEDLWRLQLAGGMDVVGSSLALEGRAFKVVGVMPRHFGFPDLDTKIWIPLNPRHRFSRGPDGTVSVGVPQVHVLGRLARGASTTAAMNEATRHLAQSDTSVSVVSLEDRQKGRIQQPLVALQGAVLILLLLACVNVSTLHLARGLERVRAHAVRLALGGSRARLVGDLLVEGSALALAGGMIGLCLTWALFAAMPALAGATAGMEGLRPDMRVACLSLFTSLFTGCLSALPSALHFSRTDVVGMLTGDTRSASGLSFAPRTVSVLVGLQVALSLALVTGATRFANSFVTLVNGDLGYGRASRVAADVRMPPSEFPSTESRLRLVDQLLDEGRKTKGFRAVSLTSALPLSNHRSLFALDAGSASQGTFQMGDNGITGLNLVDPGYFATMGIPVLSGRVFEDSDRATGLPVVVLSRSTSRRDYPHGSAIGQAFRWGRQMWTIVGVVGDVVEDPLRPVAATTACFPYFQMALAPPGIASAA